MTLRIEDAHSYWWYRLIKVLYISFLVLLTIGVIYDLDYPKVDMGESHYQIVCDDKNFTFGNLPGKGVTYNAYLDYDDVDQSFSPTDTDFGKSIEVICDLGKVPEGQGSVAIYRAIQANSPEYESYDYSVPNYKLELALKEYYPTHTDFAISIAWVIFGAIILIFLVPWMFRYIVFGKKKPEVKLD